MNENLESLVYDWNVAGERPARPSSRKIEFDDETLRDGLQSPSVTDPSIDEKIRVLHFMHAAGIDNADIGLPGAGPHVVRTVERLAREIVDNKLSVYPSAAGRTHENDVRPIIDISQRVGIAIEADLFIGSSPIRQFAEEWDIDWVIAQSANAVKFATDNGIPVMYVTEDTTRAKPEDVEKLYTAAIDAGAKRICVCDTVGHATPWGTRNLIRFVVALRDRLNPEVKVDWHGHSDRGLGVINAIAALEAGADRVHGSIPSSGATPSVPAPESTPPRSSKRRRRGASGWPTASTAACRRGCSAWSRSSRSARCAASPMSSIGSPSTATRRRSRWLRSCSTWRSRPIACSLMRSCTAASGAGGRESSPEVRRQKAEVHPVGTSLLPPKLLFKHRLWLATSAATAG